MSSLSFPGIITEEESLELVQMFGDCLMSSKYVADSYWKYETANDGNRVASISFSWVLRSVLIDHRNRCRHLLKLERLASPMERLVNSINHPNLVWLLMAVATFSILAVASAYSNSINKQSKHGPYLVDKVTKITFSFTLCNVWFRLQWVLPDQRVARQ